MKSKEEIIEKIKKINELIDYADKRAREAEDTERKGLIQAIEVCKQEKKMLEWVLKESD